MKRNSLPDKKLDKQDIKRIIKEHKTSDVKLFKANQNGLSQNDS